MLFYLADNEPPQMNCSMDILIPTSNSKPQRVDLRKYPPWVYDNSGNSTYPDLKEQIFPVGNTTIWMNSTDAADNTNNCSLTVQIAGRDRKKIMRKKGSKSLLRACFYRTSVISR